MNGDSDYEEDLCEPFVEAHKPPMLSNAHPTDLARHAANLRSQDKPATSLDQNKVRYNYDVTVTLGELMNQPDGGKELVLTRDDGITAWHHSNPSHNTAEVFAEGDVDVLHGAAEFSQTNSAGIDLHVGTNVAAPASLKSALKVPREALAAAPYGFLGADVASAGSARFERALVDLEQKFLLGYPGQTAEHQDAFVYAVHSDPDSAHIRVANPRSAVVDFYNDLPEIKERNAQLDANKAADSRGLAYADRELALRAKALCQDAMRKSISHCNLSDPGKLKITLRPKAVNMRANGKTELVQDSLVAALKKQILGVAKANGVTLSEKDVRAMPVHFTGSFTADYVKSMPTFKISTGRK